MSEKKIVVPELMLDAAHMELRRDANYPHPEGPESLRFRELALRVLEEALEPLMDILHEADADFHRAILNREREIAPGSDLDSAILTRRVDFEYGVSFARHYIRRLFAEPEPSGATETERFRAALEKLAKLGNGDQYGNSEGNEIAQQALGINRHKPQIPEDEFMECDACRAKPGSPPLCAGCLHNRHVILNLKEKEAAVTAEAIRTQHHPSWGGAK